MGKRAKNSQYHAKHKVKAKDRSRKVNKKGKLKRKRGDPRSMTSYSIKTQVVRQKKGGKNIYGERRCTIHQVCDCVTRANPTLNRVIMSDDFAPKKAKGSGAFTFAERKGKKKRGRW
eukprot:TRINITY_DN14960_c0_g1_i1.p2 TRINITY_DN14960_c0_g1~~TRINITY_DN14960_c0_g1_i1.p2  ORF type:complete len:117 (+),score=43.71 TRINITY_DN14960_c0_g1_i1:90-440(+)